VAVVAGGQVELAALDGGVAQPGGLDPLVGALGLADARLGLGQRAGAGDAAGEHAADHEDQPERDRGARSRGRDARCAPDSARERAVRPRWGVGTFGHAANLRPAAPDFAGARHRIAVGRAPVFVRGLSPRRTMPR
jgi:hypothetical protein